MMRLDACAGMPLGMTTAAAVAASVEFGESIDNSLSFACNEPPLRPLATGIAVPPKGVVVSMFSSEAKVSSRVLAEP